MSVWVCTTADGPVGVHIENGQVVVQTAVEKGQRSKTVLQMDVDQALVMSTAIEQVAFEIQRRAKRRQ